MKTIQKGLCFVLFAAMLCGAVPLFATANDEIPCAVNTVAHTVVSGDTMWKMAVRYHVGLSEIISANPHIKNPDLIYPGDTLYIPLTNTDVTNKSQDMHDKNYFSHTSPTYGSPFDMMKSFGISYRTAGENIAKGYRTPQAVVDGWMNSEGHRANILNASFKQIGVGYYANGYYWTQMFIG